MVALRSVKFEPQARSQALPSSGEKLASLIRRFGQASVNPIRAEIAQAIVKAVDNLDFIGLCNKLDLFGHTCEGEQINLSDRACLRETETLIAGLIKSINMPWRDLRRALDLPAEPPPIDTLPPTSREVARGRKFLASPLVLESNLTPQARAFLADLVQTRRDVWHDPKATFQSITQDGDRIIIIHAYGQTILSLEPRQGH